VDYFAAKRGMIDVNLIFAVLFLECEFSSRVVPLISKLSVHILFVSVLEHAVFLFWHYTLF
jgi:hypothetical protein